VTPQPNILFIFSDQQHWQATGFVDSAFETPNMDRLASEGQIFENAFCSTPQCSPSRSSIMTGLYPTRTGVLGNVGAAGGNPLLFPTIGDSLQNAGYRTAYFGKWHLGKEPEGVKGWDTEYGVTGKEGVDDRAVTHRGIDFLCNLSESTQPFALFLSYNNPHGIYEFDQETRMTANDANSLSLPLTWEKKDLSTVPAVQQQFMKEDQGHVIEGKERTAWERYREIYQAKVNQYDAEVGKVLSALEDQGLLEQTLIIVTSDHGDMDTQHGLIYKGPFMYEHMVRVPLIFRVPAIFEKQRYQQAGHRFSFPCVNVDLVPTLADFAGIEISECDGMSLKNLLLGEGDMPQRDFVIGQYYSKQKWVNPIRMIRTHRYKYNLYRVHGEELYDLEHDPDELQNLAADKSYEEVKAGLYAQLCRWIKDHHDPFFEQMPTTREGETLRQTGY